MSRPPAAAGAPSPVPAGRREKWLMAGVVAALAIAYLPVWRAGFVWDDDLHLTANPHVLSKDGLAQIWSGGAANYFPLTMTAYWALHALWGLNPLAYHLTTLGLHMVDAVLLWAVLRRLGVRGAWLGAALWALHPVQAESVAWISELKNTLSAGLYLGAVWFFLGWLEARGPAKGVGKPDPTRQYALAWLCGLLAILAKSSTVMLPVVLGLCWWWREKSWRWRDVRWLLPFLALSLAASAWTIWEQKYSSLATGADWDQSLAQRGVIAGKVVWFYLGKLLWPHPLVFIYPRWTIDATNLLAWLPTVGALAVLGFLWVKRSGVGRAWFLTAGYFVVSLFPVLGFFDVYFFRFSFVGDHLQYLASMGVMAGLGAGALTLAELPRWRSLPRAAWAALAGVVLVAGVVLTWRQSRTYADAETLYRSILARNPACWLAHNNLGILLVASGRRAEGLEHYREAVRYHPRYAEAHFNLGTVAMEAGRPAEAVQHFEVTLREAGRPDPAAYNSLGVALQQLRRAPEAVPYFEKAVALDPGLAPAQYNLANARYVAGRYTEAAEHYQSSLRLQPAQPSAENNLGLALVQLNRATEAVPHFVTALRLKPNYEEALFNLANTQADIGAVAEALPRYEALLHAKPDFAEARNNFGNALLKAGRAADAIPQYEAALRLIPDYVEAHNNLASALYSLGRGQEAIAHLETAVRLNPGYTEARNNLARLRALLQTERPGK